jgi:hypothetical protein
MTLPHAVGDYLVLRYHNNTGIYTYGGRVEQITARALHVRVHRNARKGNTIYPLVAHADRPGLTWKGQPVELRVANPKERRSIDRALKNGSAV